MSKSEMFQGIVDHMNEAGAKARVLLVAPTKSAALATLSELLNVYGQHFQKYDKKEDVVTHIRGGTLRVEGINAKYGTFNGPQWSRVDFDNFGELMRIFRNIDDAKRGTRLGPDPKFYTWETIT